MTMKMLLLPFTIGRFAACLLLLALMTQAGCKRRRSEPQTGPAPAVEASAQTQAGPAPAAGTAAQTGAGLPPQTPKATDANVARTVEELNYALQDYRERTGKMPASLGELITASKLAPARLPPGGRLELNQRFKTVEYVGPGGR